MSDCEFYLGSYIEPEQSCESALYKVSYSQAAGKLEVTNCQLAIKELTHFSLSGNHIYIANQIFSYHQGSDGAISCYRFADKDAMTLLNEQASFGTGTVYTCLDRDKNWLFISNYVAGNIVVYPVLDEYKLGQPVCMHRNLGSSINEARQEGPHPHAIEVSPCNSYIAVADLGLDKVLLYQFANDQGVINLVTELTFHCQAGSGPRHIRFHPTKHNVFYVIYEMSAHISVCQILNNKVTELAHYSLPNNGCDNITGAEIHIHPSGTLLYASVREANLLVTYTIDQTTAELTQSSTISSNGNTPLSFAICAKGQYLLVGNQTSNNMSLFAIEQQSGKLHLVAEENVEQPIMVCNC